jgi:hypothetical protein
MDGWMNGEWGGGRGEGGRKGEREGGREGVCMLEVISVKGGRRQLSPCPCLSRPPAARGGQGGGGGVKRGGVTAMQRRSVRTRRGGGACVCAGSDTCEGGASSAFPIPIPAVSLAPSCCWGGRGGA